MLLDAKGRGMSWEEIHQQHFPGKSANACRKRHERVLAKMKNTDWDDARIQRVTDAYNRHRESIWAPLCSELGESMSDIEKVASIELALLAGPEANGVLPRCSNKDFDTCAILRGAAMPETDLELAQAMPG